ncbi:MAG: stage II sporulation protein M [Methanoregula sp.]
MNEKILRQGVLYFLLLTLVLILGSGIVFFASAATHPGLVRNNAGELQANYLYHVSVITPHMSTLFLQLFVSNAGVALIILLVPLYWVGIWWLNPDHLNTIIRLMKGTVVLLVLALGYNSFSYAYITSKLYPLPVFLVMYFPHGWLEMLAFVLAGTFSLLCTDALREYLCTPRDQSALHPGGIALFIFNRVWRVFLVIAFLLAVAAAIECWITPPLVTSVWEQVLL